MGYSVRDLDPIAGENIRSSDYLQLLITRVQLNEERLLSAFMTSLHGPGTLYCSNPKYLSVYFIVSAVKWII